MDSKIHQHCEFASDSSFEDPDIVSSRCGGGIFPGSRNFVVAGGSFHVTNYATPPTTDFRTIPLGDIYLREDLGLEGGLRHVRRLHDRSSVRRIYSAKVMGLEGNMTVATYHGDDAEEEWREDILRYSWLRHPCFMQLCGITSSPTIHATVFHDDLIPFSQFVELHRHSPISTVYIYRCCATEFSTALHILDIPLNWATLCGTDTKQHSLLVFISGQDIRASRNHSFERIIP
ncbi:hypothetical protein C8R45DRAFT_300481 [Mycena sanguinolenta]|nr:hypothetical protein C8R45DRAFT_300481 [Mycena sanguinolenta]